MHRSLALTALAGVLLAGCSADKSPPAPAPASPAIRTASGLANSHTEDRVTYPDHPPLGGPHNPRWLACGVHAEQPPDENAVHSLEHGAVWLTYDPARAPAAGATLARLTEINAEYVLVTPYAGQPAPVMATAWGLQMDAANADDPRLAEFVRRYAGGGQGGEEGSPCRTNGITPAQARQLFP
jgi:hypothetical protein